MAINSTTVFNTALGVAPTDFMYVGKDQSRSFRVANLTGALTVDVHQPADETNTTGEQVYRNDEAVQFTATHTQMSVSGPQYFKFMKAATPGVVVLLVEDVEYML